MKEDKSPYRIQSRDVAATRLRLAHAMETLQKGGILKGDRSARISARVDPGLVAAARERSGIEGDSDLINAALALMVGQDNFGIWLLSRAGSLSEDFEPAI